MTRIGEYRVHYDEDTRAFRAEGTHFGNHVTVVRHDRGYLVIKVPGQRTFAGQGRAFEYRPAKFIVFRELREDGDGWLVVEEAVQFDLRG